MVVPGLGSCRCGMVGDRRVARSASTVVGACPRRSRRRRARRAAASAARRTRGRRAAAGSATSTGSSSEMPPSVSTSTRSASRTASSTSWVTSSTAGWWRAQSCCDAARASGCGCSASSAPNGSSSSSSSGSRTRARASAARWASPPDSVLGQSRSWPARPTSASAARPRSRGVAPGEPSTTLSRHAAQAAAAGPGRRPTRRAGTSTSPSASRSSPARPQQRALARAAAAEQGHELAGPDLEVDAREHRAVAEAPAQSADRDGERRSAAGRRPGVGPRSAAAGGDSPSRLPAQRPSARGARTIASDDQAEHGVDDQARPRSRRSGRTSGRGSSGSRCRWWR